MQVFFFENEDGKVGWTSEAIFPVAHITMQMLSTQLTGNAKYFHTGNIREGGVASSSGAAPLLSALAMVP